MSRWPRKVKIVEVGPRDGLQNEPDIVSITDKLAFINALLDAGVSSLEIGSMVRPDRVPQMANTDALVAEVEAEGRGDELIVLVANERGLQRALAAGARRIAVFAAASPAFSQRNTGMSLEDALTRFGKIVAEALRESVSVRGYVSTVWWCPFSGRVEPKAGVDVTQALLQMGCDEVSVADTIGAATPGEVRAVLELLLQSVPVDKVAVHFHDTRGTALANVLAALDLGVHIIDASAGGLGGCPFAPGARGNVATEDVLYMLHGMGIETGIDLDALCRATRMMQQVIGRSLPARYLAAGPPKTS
ncbi:MAG: hydroxymethylglutaryl-CoA lyase [Deltaproteobacteria bacterium]|nr:hydroxymethylglutaryl-CoA lyase [Deltaproteobacteria bacterium]